jgi:lipopolysaccharide heptosyltransferase I
MRKEARMAVESRLPLADYPARRIALIKPSALGDIIHSLPVLSALRRRFPAAHITWIVNRSYELLLRGHPDLDEVMPFDRSRSAAGLRAALLGYTHFCRRLHQQQFDLVVDLQGLLRSAVMAAATRAPRRVGLSTAREGATWFYTDMVPVANFNAIHAVDRCWLVAKAFGIGDAPKEFKVPMSAADHAWAEQVLADCPRPWIMTGVGSRWQTKRWPVEHFITLLRKAQERFGGTAVFVGGWDEQSLARKVVRRLRGSVCDLTGRTLLPQLAAVLKRADVMIANDTGPLHLAAALGRPVVAPYTCTKVLLNGPYGGEAGTVEARVWCQGSYLKRCDRLECMNELTPFRLWPLLQEVLRSWSSRSHSA